MRLARYVSPFSHQKQHISVKIPLFALPSCAKEFRSRGSAFFLQQAIELNRQTRLSTNINEDTLGVLPSNHNSGVARQDPDIAE